MARVVNNFTQLLAGGLEVLNIHFASGMVMVAAASTDCGFIFDLQG